MGELSPEIAAPEFVVPSIVIPSGLPNVGDGTSQDGADPAAGALIGVLLLGAVLAWPRFVSHRER
jgi:hypothetical protein